MPSCRERLAGDLLERKQAPKVQGFERERELF